VIYSDQIDALPAESVDPLNRSAMHVATIISLAEALDLRDAGTAVRPWVLAQCGADTGPGLGQVDDSPTEVRGKPVDLAVGEGGVWVGNRAGQVFRVDPGTGRVAGPPIPVGRDPHPVAAGPRGVWVGSSADRTITRINPEGERITGRIRVPEGVRDLAVDRIGAVWVAHGDGRGSLGRIAPDTSAAREVAAHLFPEGAVNVLVDPAGDLWVLSGTDSTSSGSGTNSTTSYIRYVHRLDPARRRDFGNVPTTDDAEELAVGEGAAWFLDPEYSTINRTGAVRRIDLTPRADLEAAKDRELTQTTRRDE